MPRSVFILFLILTACTPEEKRVKRYNQTGEYIQRKDGERAFIAPKPMPSSPPVYPWSKQIDSSQKIHLDDN